MQVDDFKGDLDEKITDIETSSSINLTGMINTLQPLVKKYESDLKNVKFFKDVNEYLNMLQGYKTRLEDNSAPSPQSVVKELTEIIEDSYEKVWVGPPGFEPGTSRESGGRHSQLDQEPMCVLGEKVVLYSLLKQFSSRILKTTIEWRKLFKPEIIANIYGY